MSFQVFFLSDSPQKSDVHAIFFQCSSSAGKADIAHGGMLRNEAVNEHQDGECCSSTMDNNNG